MRALVTGFFAVLGVICFLGGLSAMAESPYEGTAIILGVFVLALLVDLWGRAHRLCEIQEEVLALTRIQTAATQEWARRNGIVRQPPAAQAQQQPAVVGGWGGEPAKVAKWKRSTGVAPPPPVPGP